MSDLNIIYILNKYFKKRTTAFTREIREKNRRNWRFEENINFVTCMEPHMCLGIEQWDQFEMVPRHLFCDVCFGHFSH